MKKILVIDDEANIKALISDILTTEGYKVLLSDGGEDAMKLVKNEKPSLIILDMMMPRASGQELYTALKVSLEAEGKSKLLPPAIILTAHPGAENTQFLLMMEEEIVKVIPKPFQISELVDSVKEIIG